MPYFTRRQQLIEQQQIQIQQDLQQNTIFIPLKLAYLSTNCDNINSDTNINNDTSFTSSSTSNSSPPSAATNVNANRIIDIYTNQRTLGTANGLIDPILKNSNNLPNYFSLRFADQQAAKYWLDKFYSIIQAQSVQLVNETNQVFQMLNKTHTIQLKHVGWLSEQIIVNNSVMNQTNNLNTPTNNNNNNSNDLSAASSVSSSFSNNNNNKLPQFQSKPTFIALTNDSLLFYDQIPHTVDEWFQPLLNYSLLTTRLVINNNNNTLNGNNTKPTFLSMNQDEATSGYLFLTRHGTVHGTLSHFFRCLNKTELKNWAFLIENQIHLSVTQVKHIDFRK